MHRVRVGGGRRIGARIRSQRHGRDATRHVGPSGVMNGPAVLVAGTGVQTTSYNRWGDYSSMSVDPTDDCTFWYTQEYYQTTGSFNWSTRISAFKFDGCKARGK